MAVSPGEVVTWWAMASAFGGSIIGGIMSATVTFLVQRSNRKSAKLQRDEDRSQVRKALGYSLLFKMIRVTSALQNLRNAIEDNVERALAAKFDGEPWQVIQPIIHATEPVHFTSEEMALVLSLDDALFNQMAAMDELHNSTCDIFDEYATRRERVLDRFGATMNGSFGVAALTKEQVEWLAPRAVELNGLAEVMADRTVRDTEEAWAALTRLRDVLEAKLDIKHRLERKDKATNAEKA